MRRLLHAHPNVEIVGEASSLVEAERSIAELELHAVFVDIELGDGNGMEIWNRLAEKPQVVFVTGRRRSAGAPCFPIPCGHRIRSLATGQK